MLQLTAVMVVAVGCYTSVKPEGYGPALSPEGVHGVLAATSGISIRGELLEVRDSAYVMLVANRVTIVPYRALSSASFEHQDWATFDSFTSPSADTRARLRWDSRFPFGLQDRALAALLQSSGQAQPDVITVGASR